MAAFGCDPSSGRRLSPPKQFLMLFFGCKRLGICELLAKYHISTKDFRQEDMVSTRPVLPRLSE